MKPILLVNPLKPGKLNAYKEFVAEFSGPRKKEYNDLLKRHHLKTTEIWYHKLGDIEYVIVRHDLDDASHDVFASWSASTHPFDCWFKEQLNNLHDMENVNVPNLLLNYITG